VTDPELSCRELVELVTDYLEDRLPAGERASRRTSPTARGA
jgi:hypothetical protein